MSLNLCWLAVADVEVYMSCSTASCRYRFVSAAGCESSMLVNMCRIARAAAMVGAELSCSGSYTVNQLVAACIAFVAANCVPK